MKRKLAGWVVTLALVVPWSLLALTCAAASAQNGAGI